MGKLNKYSKAVVPGVILVAGTLATLFGSDWTMSTELATAIVGGVAMVVGVIFAPKNRG